MSEESWRDFNMACAEERASECRVKIGPQPPYWELNGSTDAGTARKFERELCCKELLEAALVADDSGGIIGTFASAVFMSIRENGAKRDREAEEASRDI